MPAWSLVTRATRTSGRFAVRSTTGTPDRTMRRITASRAGSSRIVAIAPSPRQAVGPYPNRSWIIRLQPRSFA